MTRPLVHVRKIRRDSIADSFFFWFGYRWRVTCDACQTLDPIPSKLFTFTQAINVATGHARSREHQWGITMRKMRETWSKVLMSQLATASATPPTKDTP